jgi:glycosyltransferase involved in cell wall biosynthesis
MSMISVIMPVYNSAKTVAESLHSILAQTYPDLEILIINDGSTDQSITLCEAFNDPRIQIIHQKNRGLAGARNTGIRHAKGEFITFIDSDDLWHPDKLARHLQHFQASPQVGVSFSRSSFIDEQSQPLGIYQMPKLTNITPEYLFCRNPISNGSAVVIRQAVFEQIRFTANLYGETEDFYFDDTYRQSEDIECWLRIALQTDWQIEGIPDALTLYRVNGDGLSANVLKQYEAWERILAKTQTYNPEFVRGCGNKAKAYQFRYLARRATRQRTPKLAVDLLNQAMTAHWQIILEEPRRTLISFAAAYLLWLLPPRFYQHIEQRMMQLTGSSQKRQMRKEQQQSTPGFSPSSVA